jgi:putative chitinase
MDRAKFYAAVRSTVTSGKLTTEQVNGFEAILNEWDHRAEVSGSYGFRGYLSDMLATAYWETNHTMQPVREAYWLSEKWRKKNLRYYPWYGRGLVQLTWDYNYRKADAKLKLGGKLIANPDLAMTPAVAIPVMFDGMEEGWFTGKTLADYRETGRQDFRNDRRIINGTDHAAEIANVADHFDAAILAAVL